MSENSQPTDTGSAVPPQLRQHAWVKGQSGNPAGRPKTPSFKKLIQDKPELDKQEVVDRVFQIAKKGRPGDAVRASTLLFKHSDDLAAIQVSTEDFTITIAPSAAMEEDDDDEA